MLGDLFAAPAAAAAAVVRVALPLRIDRLFDYALPPELGDASPGCRVRVPFDSRHLVGVVVELRAEPAPEARGRLRAVERVLDLEPVLSPGMLAMLREEAERVLCPLGLALAPALPPGSTPRGVLRLALTPRGEAARAAGALRGERGALLECLRKGPRALAGLERKLRGARSVVVELERDGLLSRRRELPRPRPRRPSQTAPAPADPGGGERVELTPEQARALESIGAAVHAREPRRFLLHGVTGSGKTEVYLRAVARALETGRQALVLVPEIPLTHQIVARLRARFGERVAVLHSGLRPTERRAFWDLLRRGVTPIAVGARSALFAPLEDLGVIILDEEHDGAYKNEEGFRYHARELAARRAAACGCPLVLGSATPSLETRFAAERGLVERLVLPHRVAGRTLPAVEIVDLERERALAPRGRKLLLSPPLLRALGQTLEAGGQSILFLNRRGFAPQILCFGCQNVERCKHCEIALVYHASCERLLCHYCDYRIAPPGVCSACGSSELALLGVGTERLFEEVRARFPAARVARLDRDSAARRGATEAVLRDLAARRLDVVVGTQMVAKGHDFPGVRLVGVVNADIGLHLPDFRAAERTFQLLTQVAGRAGRGRTPGRVIVQTFLPGHYAIRPVLDHDYERFYREELAHRSELGYPPLGHLASALCSGRELDATEAAAALLAARVRESAGCREGRVECLGPAPAPLARLRGRHRFQILLKGRAFEDVRTAAGALRDASAKLPRGVRLALDLAPQNLL